ncbi:neurogenic protein mastermind isoform X2 [Phlebotomus argentipes]|uniref:neurogenic protein mastermind isoform X2 n=1 Tax=Phlebotomus argentipes TaxID=94469 RepID=UPI0028936438|nr:neurogenic protein mastermind isoform X2 [Phlebotomus argentipes]
MDAGGLPVFQNANPAQHQLNNQIHTLQQQQLNQQLQHQLAQQQQNDVLPPKRQAVVDRLKRRIENYRRRQSETGPKFTQTFHSVCEQQNLETTVLQKKFLESKAKKAAKKTDKKQSDNTLAGNLQSSVHVQQKFLKRPSDEVEAGPDSYEPPVKLQHNGSENLTKFSVEIVQQLEFTTSAANSQPQQISTNVTVKALTNTSVKSDGGLAAGGGAANGATQQPQQGQAATNGSGGAQKSPAAPQMDLGNLVECKQEPDHDFADLEQCAAALEKDAAANGHFPGLSDLIGDDTNDESDTFKELISDLSDFHPELLDFEEKPQVEIKTEDKEQLQHSLMEGGMMKGGGAGSPMTQFPGGAFSDNQSMGKRGFGGAGGNGGGMSELSPAAQTLKHMAEQHQHKSAMGMGFPRPGQAQGGGGGAPNGQQQWFGGGGGGDFQGNFHKNGPPSAAGSYPSPDMVKQEMMYAQNEFDLKRMAQMPPAQAKMGGGAPAGAYKQQQQYSPYGSPSSMSNHGSPGPGFMGPRGGQGPQSSGPPRPPSGPGGAGPQGGQGTLQMKQTQQLHISQQGPGGHGIQVSAGQHLHLSGDLKSSNVSVAAQQGVYFNQPAQQPAQPQQSQAPPVSQAASQAAQNSQGIVSDSYSVSQSQSINFTQQNMRRGQAANGAGIQTMAGNNAVTNPNMSQAQMVSMSQSQHMSVSGMVQGSQQPGAGQMNNPMGMAPNMMNQGQMGGMGMGNPNGMVGAPNMMANMGGGGGGGGPSGGPMPGMRHDPTKFMQQQQMMQRAQAMQHMQGARPPPPEYKAAQAQMIQAQMMHQGGPGGRFPNSAAAMRRMSQQPIPPSGPMMRPQHSMYMQHPNHGGPRAMAPYGQRPPNVQVGPEGMPMGSQQEWRHIFMSQQQNMNFNSSGMRSNFTPNHQGFGMQNAGPGGGTGGGGGGGMQMTPMQQQMMRNQQQQQQQQPNGGQGQMVGMNQSTMQQMLVQQQQQGMMGQMQMNTMHMSQSQSMSLQQQSVMNNFSQTTQQNAAMISSGQTQAQPAVQPAPQTTSSAAISPSGNDFNFEFLENLPVGDTSGFSAQDLFNSLDNDSFNLQDMLQ